MSKIHSLSPLRYQFLEPVKKTLTPFTSDSFLLFFFHFLSFHRFIQSIKHKTVTLDNCGPNGDWNLGFRLHVERLILMTYPISLLSSFNISSPSSSPSLFFLPLSLLSSYTQFLHTCILSTAFDTDTSGVFNVQEINGNVSIFIALKIPAIVTSWRHHNALIKILKN